MMMIIVMITMAGGIQTLFEAFRQHYEAFKQHEEAVDNSQMVQTTPRR